jgi:hypothetical protein
MPKILRQFETKEIEYFLSNSDKVSPKLKKKIQDDLKDKADKFKNNFIWLIERNEALTIDVFDVKGDIIETESFCFKDYPVNL